CSFLSAKCSEIMRSGFDILSARNFQPQRFIIAALPAQNVLALSSVARRIRQGNPGLKKSCGATSIGAGLVRRPCRSEARSRAKPLDEDAENQHAKVDRFGISFSRWRDAGSR